MSEHHSPEFDDPFDDAPPPEMPTGAGEDPRQPRVPVADRIAGPAPRRISPPPQFTRPPSPLPSSDPAAADPDPAAFDHNPVGAHRVSEPRPDRSDDHTSIMRLDGNPEIEAARAEYARRYGPGGEHDDDAGSAVRQHDSNDRFRQPLPGRAAPSAAQRPRSAWPDTDDRRGDPRGTQHDAPAPNESRGWDQAQGSSASWNYTDTIRSGEMVPSRRVPPERGWRKVVYVGSGGLINPGQSPDERHEAELRAKCRTLLRGTYKIGVLGKGGAGKSTTSAGVGSMFAELRQDDRVVAIDADTAFGKLASRVDPRAAGSYWELAGDRNLHSFADIRTRVGSNNSGLFVLGGDPATARRRKVDPDIYRQATIQIDRHFTLSIIDCGSTLDADITLEVLGDVQALIVVSSPWFDGASAAGQTLEWLANNGYTQLLARTVVVVNDSDGHASRKDLTKLSDRFRQHGQKVVEMPYDDHLRPGGVVDVHELNKQTQRRLLELAAHCAEHFASTTDNPRGYR